MEPKKKKKRGSKSNVVDFSISFGLPGWTELGNLVVKTETSCIKLWQSCYSIGRIIIMVSNCQILD